MSRKNYRSKKRGCALCQLDKRGGSHRWSARCLACLKTLEKALRGGDWTRL